MSGPGRTPCRGADIQPRQLLCWLHPADCRRARLWVHVRAALRQAWSPQTSTSCGVPAGSAWQPQLQLRGPHQVEGVAHGHRGCQGHVGALLPQVAHQDVGCKRWRFRQASAAGSVQTPGQLNSTSFAAEWTAPAGSVPCQQHYLSSALPGCHLPSEQTLPAQDLRSSCRSPGAAQAWGAPPRDQPAASSTESGYFSRANLTTCLQHAWHELPKLQCSGRVHTRCAVAGGQLGGCEPGNS